MRYTIRFALCVAFLLSSLGFVSRASAQSTRWHSLSQQSRNRLILSEAQRTLDGTRSGDSCKVWVQKVVSTASGQVVSLPLNDPYCEWRWLPHKDVVEVACDRWDGVEFWPGQIIQAQVRTRTGGTTPHTMIVVWANARQVSVIESNWKGDTVVRRRTATWAEFKRSVIHYTLYSVR